MNAAKRGQDRETDPQVSPRKSGRGHPFAPTVILLLGGRGRCRDQRPSNLSQLAGLVGLVSSSFRLSRVFGRLLSIPQGICFTCMSLSIFDCLSLSLFVSLSVSLVHLAFFRVFSPPSLPLDRP